MYVILNQVIYFKYKLSGLYVGSNTINKYKKHINKLYTCFDSEVTGLKRHSCFPFKATSYFPQRTYLKGNFEACVAWIKVLTSWQWMIDMDTAKHNRNSNTYLLLT